MVKVEYDLAYMGDEGGKIDMTKPTTTTNNPSTPIRVYIYTRVSTEMQTDGYSLDAQRVYLEKYCSLNSYTICGYYSDEGFSGKNIEGRQQFKRMLVDITTHKDKVNFVLCYKLSRFGRNTADILTTLETLKDNDCGLICPMDNIDSSSATGNLIITILAAIAEIERENILVQTMAGRKQKASQGLWNGGFAPFGYILKNGNLEIVPEEAEVVRKIFTLYNQNNGFSSIARQLKLEGIQKTRNIRKRNPETNELEDAPATSNFTAHTLKQIIDNPIYKGYIAYGRRKTEKIQGKHNEYHVVKETDPAKVLISKGTHTPIISEEEWELAQSTRKITGKKTEKKYDHVYILATLLKCPFCGKTLYGIPHAPRKKADGTFYPTYYSYACRNGYAKRALGETCPSPLQISAHQVEPVIEKLIFEDILQSERIRSQVEGVLAVSTETDSIKEEISNYEKHLRQLKARQLAIESDLDNLDYLSPTVGKKKESLESRLDSCFEEMERTTQNIEEAKERLSASERGKINRGIIFQMLENASAHRSELPKEDIKDLFNLLIERIDLYKEKTRGRRIKSVKFRFPVYFSGDMVEEIDFDTYEVKPQTTHNTEDKKVNKYKKKQEKKNLPLKRKHDEMVCLLSKLSKEE